jgi:Raf kinase inhibitor-like YbhB/YbcL family protein
MVLRISSPAYTDGVSMPAKYTCEGKDLSPPLEWSGVPAGTKSFVLIIDDPDAPDPKAPRMTWVHWVLYDLPPDSSGLPEDANSKGLPAGTKVGINDWKRPDYGGPCPPIGRHRYFHKLYALDTKLSELSKPTKADIEAAMKGHVLAEAVLIWTYQKAA